MAQDTEIQFLSQVFDGAVIILSLAPMVASTVANGPRSPWDAISLIIMLRIWRVKRVIDGEWSKKGQKSWLGDRWLLPNLELSTPSAQGAVLGSIHENILSLQNRTAPLALLCRL